MREYNNDDGWRDAFDEMFGAIQMRDCTPDAVLQTMRDMPRKSNRLHDIVIAAREKNIAANDDDVLDCLRVLYKQGKIAFRDIACRQFFITKSSTQSPRGPVKSAHTPQETQSREGVLFSDKGSGLRDVATFHRTT